MPCCGSCWSEDHTLSSRTIHGRDVPHQPVRCRGREDVPLGHLWVVAFQWDSSSGSKPRGNRVGSSKWPQDVIMSLQEFSGKGSSLGVILHTLRQQSGSYLIRAASGTHPSENCPLGFGTDVKLTAESSSYPPYSTHLVLSPPGPSDGLCREGRLAFFKTECSVSTG